MDTRQMADFDRHYDRMYKRLVEGMRKIFKDEADLQIELMLMRKLYLDFTGRKNAMEYSFKKSLGSEEGKEILQTFDHALCEIVRESEARKKYVNSKLDEEYK